MEEDMVHLLFEGWHPTGSTVDCETYQIVKAYLAEGRKEVDIVRELIASDFKQNHAIRIVVAAKHDNGFLRVDGRYVPVPSP